MRQTGTPDFWARRAVRPSAKPRILAAIAAIEPATSGKTRQNMVYGMLTRLRNF